MARETDFSYNHIYMSVREEVLSQLFDIAAKTPFIQETRFKDVNEFNKSLASNVAEKIARRWADDLEEE